MNVVRARSTEDVPKLCGKVATEFVAEFMRKFSAQGIRSAPSTHKSSFVVVLSSEFPASPSTTVHIQVSPDYSGITQRLVLDIVTVGNYSNLVFQYAREVARQVKRDYQDVVSLEVNTKKPPEKKR